MIRRSLLKGLAAMTFPGLGGQQPAPQNAPPASQPQPGVTPGVSSQIVATRVIIVGANGELLVYNPTVAHGNLVASIAGTSGSGLAGDSVVGGLAAYDSSGDYAQLFSAELNFLIVGMTQAASLSLPSSAEVQLTSGEQTAGDIASQVILQSADSAGGASTITLSGSQVTVINNFTVNGTLTVGGSTSTQLGDNGGVTSGPSGTVNAFPAAGPNHTHAEAHHHPF